MAISFPSGFKITSTEAVDSRLLLTKTEMKNVKKAAMPSVYFCICKDDGQFYLYNSANDIDEETGRFRVFKSSSITIDQDTTNAIVSTDEDNILVVNEDGTLKVTEADSISQEQIQTLFTQEGT